AQLIRFDSRGLTALPVSTLCAKGASDLGTSLVGLAKVGLASGAAWDAERLAGCVVAAYQGLQKQAPQLLEEGKALTPGAIGTRGSATMLIGLGICLAYRTMLLGRDKPDELLTGMVDTAKGTFDEKVNGGFSGPMKRQLLGWFARLFFATDAVE